MPSGFALKFMIKYKRFRRWMESDRFMELIGKAVAWFIIGIFVLSAFVVMVR